MDEDAESLQDDLNKLQDWEADWQMHVNPDKCELIRITNKGKTIKITYLIQSVHLKQTKRAKYLGLTFSNTLSWNTHIDTISKKANNTTAFLQRNLSTCPKKQNICEASSEICGHSLGSTHNRQHQKGRSCTTESSRFLTGDSLHQQCHSHDREPYVGNPPTQKTASQGHYDVFYCTCHGSYTSL